MNSSVRQCREDGADCLVLWDVFFWAWLDRFDSGCLAFPGVVEFSVWTRRYLTLPLTPNINAYCLSRIAMVVCLPCQVELSVVLSACIAIDRYRCAIIKAHEYSIHSQ
jgi:hypothetical protein